MYGETGSASFLVDDSGIEFDPASMYFIDEQTFTYKFVKILLTIECFQKIIE